MDDFDNDLNRQDPCDKDFTMMWTDMVRGIFSTMRALGYTKRRAINITATCLGMKGKDIAPIVRSVDLNQTKPISGSMRVTS